MTNTENTVQTITYLHQGVGERPIILTENHTTELEAAIELGRWVEAEGYTLTLEAGERAAWTITESESGHHVGTVGIHT